MTLAIDPILYKQISDDYSAVFADFTYVSDTINAALAHLAGIDNIEAKLDLLKPLRMANNAIAQDSFSRILSSVTVLNNSVINRTGLQLNDYLKENGILVLPEWAELCASTGVTIDPSNIAS